MQVPPRDEAMRGSAEWFQGRACRKIGARFRDIKSLEGSTQILFLPLFSFTQPLPQKVVDHFCHTTQFDHYVQQDRRDRKERRYRTRRPGASSATAIPTTSLCACSTSNRDDDHADHRQLSFGTATELQIHDRGGSSHPSLALFLLVTHERPLRARTAG